MYTILNNKRVNIIEETFDDITLTLYIKPNLKMSTVYELFESTDLHTITIYNDDDTLYGTRSEYINVGNFTFDKFSNWYIINLIRDKIDNLKVRMDVYDARLDTLSGNISQITTGDFTKQSEYALRTLASTFSDSQALNCVLLFPEWDGKSVSYKKNERVRYLDKLYKVLQEHVSQSDWSPDKAVSLYVEVSDPSIEYPEWKQPTGAHDAYAKGDKVTYKGKKYISLIDANTYSPEAYLAGWQEVN